MITKPAVAGKRPVVIRDSDTLTTRTFSAGTEFVSLHYVNTTAGAGRVDVYDGVVTPSNLRISLSSDAANGNDDYSPAQNWRFNGAAIFVFTTGTGAVTILAN